MVCNAILYRCIWHIGEGYSAWVKFFQKGAVEKREEAKENHVMVQYFVPLQSCFSHPPSMGILLLLIKL